MLKRLNSDIPVKVEVKGNLYERNLKYLFEDKITSNSRYRQSLEGTSYFLNSHGPPS